MTDLPDAARAVLDRIASGEAKDYNLLFGGHRFKSYSDHPRIKVPLEGGLYSTAAGRYQMLASTWDRERQALGLKDFSPASQDLAAWSLAQRTYKQKTGRDLAADAAQDAVDYSVLGNQWTSLRGSPPRGSAPTNPGATAIPSPPLQAPAPASLALESPLSILHQLPRGARPPLGALPIGPGASLSLYQDKDFTPVDHNPFAGTTEFEPVNHDPFQPVEKED